jgi:hypothetical protein
MWGVLVVGFSSSWHRQWCSFADQFVKATISTPV